MKQVKIIHLADIHFAPDKKAEALASLETAYEIGKKELVDLFVIAGDLFERAIYNTKNSGLPELQRMIQKMMTLAPVVAISGTPSHDSVGCYEILQETNADHSFTLLDPHHAYFLINGEVFSDQEETQPFGRRGSDLLILGMPEPSKEWFLSDKRMGGEEASEAIKDGMRDMLLGFGAIRKEYPTSPCIFLYHGLVAGSSLANGQIMPAGGIQIGKDDLALVGADYYALGHIHLAQQIGDLPAYYAGSAYPVDWGETDQKSCNVITFHDNQPLGSEWKPFFAEIQNIPFPHPPRKKITIDWFHTIDEPYKGFQTWLNIRAKKEQLPIDTDSLLEVMYIHGALLGSRVTTEIIPTETVRAGEIQEVKTLREKVEIYAKNSGETAGLNVLDKADELESEARREGEGVAGLHIRIDKLSLRGAIGIQKGQGKDEIEVDLSTYDPGLIALFGINGSGKTTLLENMHPFPDLLTRSGKLQDHFRLRDSHRDFYFTDELSGNQYRAFIQIDGQNKTGKAEYHLYKNGQPLTNGRKDEYESEILKLFGSLSLFQRSAFIAQKPSKNNPDLSEATKGEKKALFRELGGLDYLQAHSETAKENGKSLEEQITESRGRVAILQGLIVGLTDLEFQKRHDEGNLAMVREALKELEKSNRDLKAAAEQLKARVDQNRETQAKITDANERMHELRRDAHNREADIEDYQEALKKKEEIEKALAEYESLKVEESKLNEEKARILEERERLLSEYRNLTDIAADECQKIDTKKAEISQKMAVLQQKKAVFLNQIEHLIEQTAKSLDENCPTCGQLLPEGKLDELKDEREQKIAELKQIQSDEFEIEQEIVACKKQIAEYDQRIAAIIEPVKPELPEWDSTRIDEVQFGLDLYDLAELQKILARANDAQVRIEENQKQLKKINEQQESLTKQLAELNKRINSDCERQYDEAAAELEAVEQQYIDGREEVRGMEVALEKLEEAIGDLKDKRKELAYLQQTIKDKESEIIEWRYLERACGPDGIQALELDAMGPSVAEVANQMLEAAYGSRFKVEFRTTRIGGSGSKTKQIEDFQIWILDSQTGDEQLLETLSGGESVWIKRAIYDAFGIVRDRNTGQRFLTAFQDESDGALDPEARVAYFRMLERAHQISGRNHTIVISHSEAAQEIIAQKIEMADLGVREPVEIV